jgi:Cu/Zn superoxide dismutase
MRVKHAVIPLAALLVLAGCGGGDDDTADAAAASAIADAHFAGTFAKVPNAPKGTAKVAGSATLTNSPNGVLVTVAATGLNPKAVYVAHVHNDVCSAADPGGTHFKYDPAGGDLPPNELHLALTVSKKGKGTATTTNPTKAGPAAKSVVIHLKRPAGAKKDEVKPPKVACADLVAK